MAAKREGIKRWDHGNLIVASVGLSPSHSIRRKQSGWYADWQVGGRAVTFESRLGFAMKAEHGRLFRFRRQNMQFRPRRSSSSGELQDEQHLTDWQE